MSNKKSYAEFVLGLYAAQLKDCAVQYPALAKEFERDFSRISSAIESHGIRFALDVLATWRKHFDVCLSNGRLTRSSLLHFSSWKKEGTVPKLFRGLVLRVFDLTGELKSTPDVKAICLIRQLCGVVRKLRVDCTERANSDAVREFIRVDQEVRLGSSFWEGITVGGDSSSHTLSIVDRAVELESSSQALLPGFLSPNLPYRHAECIQQAADIISSCLGFYDPADSEFRHGPGAVSDHPYNSYKYEFDRWPDRLDEFFPMADFASANYSHWLDSLLYTAPIWDTQREVPAKLCAVPKTIKTPRLIAAEPTSFQWCQQSVRSFMYNRVGRSVLGSFVDFHRQESNGALALEASRFGSHCTIDLSSASDRISCWVVERIFRQCPTLLNALRASRSLYIKQDICGKAGRFHKLRKFSTMGNAVTFPVQSLVFLAVSLGSLSYIRGERISYRMLRSLGSRTVRVFGDDLIVPADCAGSTIDALEALGLKVNYDKTFVAGRFRESCGVDAYAGEDVTSVSVLSVPMRAKPGSIVSSVDVYNNFVKRGYMHTSHFIRRTVEPLVRFKVREVAMGSGSFGWYPNFLNVPPTLAMRQDRFRFVRQVRCLTTTVKQRKSPPDGSASLLQFFTEAAKEVTRSNSGLGHPQKRAKVSLRLGWVDL